ncbi:MAG: hypothetical protein F6J94_20835 [Moorea sp. SIO1F2]|nr:hypothetical protein [Moorena sp. SIO1F2]
MRSRSVALWANRFSKDKMRSRSVALWANRFSKDTNPCPILEELSAIALLISIP